MSRTAAFAALVAIALGLTVWWVAARVGGAPAQTVSQRHALPPFHAIAIDGDADVTLVQGDEEAIAIVAGGGSSVRADVADGVLMIRAHDARPWWSLAGSPRRAPRVSVSFRDVDAIRAAGFVRLDAALLRADAIALRFSGATKLRLGSLDARALSLAGSGAFEATIGGRVGEQRVTISGAGDYRAGDLASERATVVVSGAGRVLVAATDALDVELSGAAKVDYRGSPKVTQRVSGAARVRRVEGPTVAMPLARLNAARPRPAEPCPA